MEDKKNAKNKGQKVKNSGKKVEKVEKVTRKC